jgi:hypothetical protein
MVLWAIATVVEHDESHSQGGTQVTTRQMIGPRHGSWLLHCPYRNLEQPVLRLPQLSSAQWQSNSVQV